TRRPPGPSLFPYTTLFRSGQDALAQVVHALEVDAVGDHQLAGPEQVLQRAFRGLPVPPGPALRAVVLEVGGAQCALRRDPLADVPQHLLVVGLVMPVGPVTGGLLLPALHLRRGIAVVLKRNDRRGVPPVLEQAALARI